MRLDQGARMAGVVALVVGVACNGEDPTGPPGGVHGNWSVNATIDATQCAEGVYSDSYTISISQDGNDLDVTISGVQFTGTLNGAQGTWTGSYPEDGGTTTETYSVTFSNNNSTMTGGSNWTWSDGAFTCSGTVSLTGSK